MATAAPAAHSAHGSATPERGGDQSLPLTILTSLFFLWGFLTCLNDILIPHLKAAFSLNYTEAALIQFSFFTAYAVMSLPSGALVKRIGYQRGIVIGLGVAGLGCLLFYPAASTRMYGLFLGALFVLASGITLLQVSANPYVTLLGPPETASSRLVLTQAFNSLGTTLAPRFGALVILSVAVRSADEIAKMAPVDLASYAAAEAASVQVPYVGLAAVLILIAVVFSILKLPSVDHSGEANLAAYWRVMWRRPHLALGVLAIFTYVGAEVSIGSFLVNFMKLPEVANLPEQSAANYLMFYWGGAMVGRFVGSALLRQVEPGKLLALFALVAATLALATMALSGSAAMWSILAVGLFNSIMFPTIFTLALVGLGEDTALGSGLLCMAIVGGALLPVAHGAIADAIGLHHAFFLPAICYLFIAWYGLKGSRPRAA